jgi:hypothetical protein
MAARYLQCPRCSIETGDIVVGTGPGNWEVGTHCELYLTTVESRKVDSTGVSLKSLHLETENLQNLQT